MVSWMCNSAAYAQTEAGTRYRQSPEARWLVVARTWTCVAAQAFNRFDAILPFMEPCRACYKRCGIERLCKNDPLPLGEVNFDLMDGFEYSMAEWMAYL